MILGELAAREPKAQTAKPEQFVDLSFIKELDASGFIDRLYKGKPVVAAVNAPKLPAASVKETAVPAKAAAVPVENKPVAPTAKPSPAPAPAPSTTPKGREYTVKAGDTLGRLAQQYYGDVLKWTRIFEANRQTLKTPDYIFVGQKLLIPADDIAGNFAGGASQ
jgi:nucleoid-associated protein YgaU